MTKVKVTAEYQGHPVGVGDHVQYRFNEHHLKNNLELLKSCVQRHNKIFAWRMDIRLPQDHEKVKVKKTPKKFIGDFMNVFTNKLAREGLDPDYIIRMEQKTSENPHFHAMMFVDGNKVKDQKKYCEMGEKLIETQLGMDKGAATGLINYTGTSRKRNKDMSKEEVERQEHEERKMRKKNSYMIRRTSPHFEEQFNECFSRSTYLAKDDVNDIIPSSERKVMYSRFKRKRCRRKD